MSSQGPTTRSQTRRKHIGGWVYKKDLSKSDGPYASQKAEVKVKGYPWVSISTISKETPLGYHSHHSKNTHLIVDGQIKFTQRNGTATNCGKVDGLKWFFVSEDTEYKADLTGKRRCIFVEGHEMLSPSTRDRFIERGDIEWVPGGKHEGPVAPEVEAEGDVMEEVWHGLARR